MRKQWNGTRLLLRRRDRVDRRGAGACVGVEHARLPQQRPRRPGARVLRLLSSLAVLGLGAGLAVAAAGGVPGPAEKSAALGRLASVATTDSNTAPAPARPSHRDAIPARMLGPDVPVPVSPALLRARNGWLVSDGREAGGRLRGRRGLRPGARKGRDRPPGPGRRQADGPRPSTPGRPEPSRSRRLRWRRTSAQTAHLRLRTAGGRRSRSSSATGSLTSSLRSPATVTAPPQSRSSDSTSHPIRR